MVPQPPADRCAWSGERSPRVIRVELPAVDRLGRPRPPIIVPVLPEHEAALRAHALRVRRYGARFLVGVYVLGTLAFVAAMAAALRPDWSPFAMPAAGILLALIGILFVALPFSTPETAAFFGVRRSIAIARFLGVVLVVMGVWIAPAA